MRKVLSHEAMSLMAVSHTAHDKISWNALWDYIADLEEFKAIVEGCGFKVMTEPPVLNYPERKILQGHGVMYVPTPPEVQESEATSCKFCGSNKSDIRMNSIVCTSCGRKIGNIAPPEVQQ